MFFGTSRGSSRSSGDGVQRSVPNPYASPVAYTTSRRNGSNGTGLATVVRTWGSSPRPVGSIMALADDGTLVGSVSGGCIEDDLVDRFAREHAAPAAGSRLPELVAYGVSADEAHRFGLPCGGTLELLLERDPDADALAPAMIAVFAGVALRRQSDLADEPGEAAIMSQSMKAVVAAHLLGSEKVDALLSEATSTSLE